MAAVCSRWKYVFVTAGALSHESLEIDGR